MGRFLQIFVAGSENLNFIIWLLYRSYLKQIIICISVLITWYSKAIWRNSKKPDWKIKQSYLLVWSELWFEWFKSFFLKSAAICFFDRNSYKNWFATKHTPFLWAEQLAVESLQRCSQNSDIKCKWLCQRMFWVEDIFKCEFRKISASFWPWRILSLLPLVCPCLTTVKIIFLLLSEVILILR